MKFASESTPTPLQQTVLDLEKEINEKIAQDLKKEGAVSYATRMSMQAFFAFTTTWPFAYPIDSVVSNNGTLIQDVPVLPKSQPSEADDHDEVGMVAGTGFQDFECKF